MFSTSVHDMKVARPLLLVLLLSVAAADPSDGRKVCNSTDVAECTDDDHVQPVELLQHDLQLSKRVSMEPKVRHSMTQVSVAEVDSLAHMASTTPVVTTTATEPPTGLSMNAVGDMKTFIASVIMYYTAAVICILCFSVMRRRYPIMYQHNEMTGKTPMKLGDGLFAWFAPTMRLTVEQVMDYVSLDHAMLIEYTHLCMKIMLGIGFPMFCFQGPMNWIFGDNRAGQDHLSYLSFGNVVNDSWLYWQLSLEVWLVVIYTTWLVHGAMRKFIPLRFKFLKQMSTCRANTVLVEGIPEDYRSEPKVRELFENLLPGAAVKSVEVVKDTTALECLVSQHENALLHLHTAEAQVAAHPDQIPMIRESMMGSKVEAIPYWKRQADEFEPQVKRERQRLLAESKNVGGVNLSVAFVTFASRTYAELALRLDTEISGNKDEWNIFTAPDPTEILWADLTQDENAHSARTVIGNIMIVVLAFLYMPLVIGVTNLGKVVQLKYIGLGSLQSVWDGVAPTLGLELMVCFLPTFLINIFKAFYTCRAENLQQHKLQIFYFWFQVLFVILATAVGQNFKEFAITLVSDPAGIIPVMADTMPYATHYYMNYLVMQAMSHGMNCTRYIAVAKFKGFAAIFDEDQAKAMAEPEDQDYYGMGSRSARWTIMLGIGLVYGTLSPPINVLCFINFFICRVIYGYLFMFAESHKPDTGGCFFVSSLLHIFWLLMIYVILMAGVFYQRARTVGPCVISALSVIWVIVSVYKFQAYTWEKLPMLELEAEKDIKRRADQGQYIQSEMLEKKTA
mmetsp:Transcript_112747/g.299529  ORF Transcript_112747/g.299529 Transcript_112747/m.299529 type:complete len:791 (-) Transcript_112747:102-2474(-)